MAPRPKVRCTQSLIVFKIKRSIGSTIRDKAMMRKTVSINIDVPFYVLSVPDFCIKTLRIV